MVRRIIQGVPMSFTWCGALVQVEHGRLAQWIVCIQTERGDTQGGIAIMDSGGMRCHDIAVVLRSTEEYAKDLRSRE